MKKINQKALQFLIFFAILSCGEQKTSQPPPTKCECKAELDKLLVEKNLN